MKKLILMLALIHGGRAVAQTEKYSMPQKGICAHRGGMDTHPENTVPAFEYSIATGVQMIEFDIQFSKDSVLVIMHDDSVDRTTDGHGKVSELTLKELKALDAGGKKDAKFKGVKVPTLEETLAMMPKNIWLNCHLKGSTELGRAVAQMVKKAGRLHQCLLACSEEAAAGAREKVQNIIICNADNRYRQNNAKYVDATIKQKAGFIQLVAVGTLEERKPFVQKLRDNGIKVNYFFAAKKEEAASLWNIGVNFILVNDLPAFLPEMKKYGIPAVNNVFASNN